MKIFGWMHKKLQLGTHQYQRVANKNDPDVVINEESDAGKMDKATEIPLLHHHILLTIGTFGYSDPDPLLLQPSQLPQSPINHHENSNNIDKQIEKARARALPSTEISKPELPIQEFGKDSTKQEVEITEEDINMVEPLLEEDIKRSITEKRTTLADLFAAEPPMAILSPAAAVPRILRTCGNYENNILKKVMEKNKFDEPRIKTIHGLIARMLRKRIYLNVVVRVEDGEAGPLRIKDGTAKSDLQKKLQILF